MGSADQAEASAEAGGAMENLLQSIAKLQEENNRQRVVNRNITLVGLLVVFLVLLIFCFRLYGIYDNYNQYAKQLNAGNLGEVLSNPESDIRLSDYDAPEIEGSVKELIKMGHDRIGPSVAHSRKKLVNEIIPDFTERVTDRFAERSDEFVEKGMGMVNELKDHAQKQVENQLNDIMGEAMVELSDEVAAQFPEMSDKKLKTQLSESEAYFYDELHHLGMTKIAKFDPVLRGLKNHLENMADGKVTPEMREEITNRFLEALFDRVKYEFVPGLGDELIEPPKNGKKDMKKGGQK